MKTVCSIFCIALLFVSCQPKVDNTAQLKFEENSKTVKALMDSWQSENVDYSLYADDVVIKETAFGAKKDSTTLAEMKEHDKKSFAAFDFKFLGDPVFLPGVNSETKMADGSVRYYGDWEVIRSATDSTEAKSGTLSVYHSFDFNDEGKIVYEQMYGDFGGLWKHLFEPEMDMNNNDEDATEE
ncbi:hypothetical protein [Aestuariivivens insulae]|uniref:hypothetical protein n=1 Tax=Aestuariivivens insulae TaxID=1621988 RepID=UPI001F5665DF|nr:hypothetical protein [Aestuariivivens insulae]